MTEPAKAVEEVVIRLDLGCGKNKRDGFIGVDSRPFNGVDQVVNLASRNIAGAIEQDSFRNGKIAGDPAFSWREFNPWPWSDESVDEVHCSHFVEHLNADERIHFVNELYRVLKKGAKATIIIPHWASSRAYGDLTHQWPPVSEFWFYYLNKEWRAQNAPHNDGYACDFDATWGYSMHPALHVRNQEYQMYALSNFKEAAQDIIATLIKK